MDELTHKNLFVIGDSCIDHEIQGEVAGLSPEAPIPLLKNPVHTHNRGMVDNFLNNLAASFSFFENTTVLPHDIPHIISEYPSDIWRFISRPDNTQLLRVDKEPHHIVPLTIEEVRTKMPKDCRAIMILDYDTRWITAGLIENIKKEYGPTHTLFIDSRKEDLRCCIGYTVKSNLAEHKIATKICPTIENDIIQWNGSDRKIENDIVQWIRSDQKIDYPKMIVTMGGDGARIQDTHYPQNNKVEVRDVTGCGETFFAAYIAYMIHHYRFEARIGHSIYRTNKAMGYANYLASVAATKQGVWYPRPEHIKEALREEI